ncbi:MAG: AMP-binding protein [bacterium]|nr:AMP-binding protein [bacterium]
MNALRRVSRALGFVSAFGRVVPSALRFGPQRRVEFSDSLAEHFQRRPDQPALVGESSRMTWGELDRHANRVANWALGQGLERGDVVALLMENRAEYVATWLGLSRVGVVTALLNTHLTGDRLAHCIREAGADYLIVGSELAEGAASVLPELETKPTILLASFDDASDAKAATLLEATSFDAACEAAGDAAVPESVRAARTGADGLFYIYTSGTTGLPKAARVSHSKAMTAAVGCWKFQSLTPADRLYCCLPLYHSAGGMLAAGGILMAGGTLVIARRFSASRFWSDCVQHEVTVFQYIGELCRYLLNSPTHPDENRHRIRTAMGNGLRPEVWGPFVERFKIPRIVEFYGATEGNMMLLNHDSRVGAIGYLPPLLRKAQGIQVARFDVVEEAVIRGEDGFCTPADFDEPGELLMKINATQRFEGYTNEEASKKKILTDVFEKGDAYFRTGDLLRLDRDGYFYFVDRIGDTFRWKGENVSTNEVAEVL